MADNSFDKESIVSEAFCPELNEYFAERYHKILAKLNNTLAINRVQLLEKEISAVGATTSEIEQLKYIATLRVLIDLSQQGWLFDMENNGLALRMESDDLDDKQKLRYRMSAECRAQFREPSVKAFIKRMEKTKIHNGREVSIRSLIGDAKLLVEKIRADEIVCQPYLELVTAGRDEQTGYYLSDIWRYFRYTWSIPYKTMPGRNMYYLVRDAGQANHPVIGIFALGNAVLNLKVRDDDIGWTLDAIRSSMSENYDINSFEQKLAGGNVYIKVRQKNRLETPEEFAQRATNYANNIYPLLLKNIKAAIDDIYIRDLPYHRQTRYPRQEQIDELLRIAEECNRLAINNRNDKIAPNYEWEAKSHLFRRKRATELAKLLQTQICFNSAKGTNYREKLLYLLARADGRKAIKTALLANRKCKIGANMMEIIVCGAIPPYNELLGGKLVSMLACSPTVIRDYTERYKKQVSEIASRMKGCKVIRDSRLVFLGTTSLYAVGSSQYNRIKFPVGENELVFKKMGITAGFGTVFFSKQTTAMLSKILELQDGGRRIGNVFGEGTSPRFRTISKGLSAIGIRSEAFLRHYSPRIVYSIPLARNAREFLLGLTDEPIYGFDISNENEVAVSTQSIIDFWYRRWLTKRLNTVDIQGRLGNFKIEHLLLGFR